MSYKIIDVSTWQGDIDWQKVKADGVQGAIIRACFGWDIDSQIDKKFYENVKGAKAAGVPIGAYHYSYATSEDDARKEAAFFRRVTKGINFELPIFFDIEEKTVHHSMTGKKLTDISCAFCEDMEKHSYYVGIYTFAALFNRFDYERIKRYTLWVADYRGYNGFKHKSDMWQYTSSGKVNGISGRCDLNHCYRDYLGEIKARGGNPIIEQKEDENMIKELQATINTMQSDINNLKSQLSSKTNELSDVNALNMRLQSEVDKLKADLQHTLKLNAEYCKDLNLLLDEVEKLKAAQGLQGDINGDGKINTVDALLILKQQAGLK